VTVHVEEWRPVPDYPHYEVSSLGNVRGWLRSDGHGGVVRRGHPRSWVFKPFSTYYRVANLWTDGKFRKFYVHELVLLAFVGPRPPGLDIAHLNGDQIDNRLENLAYVTHQENMRQAIGHGRTTAGTRNPRAVLTDAMVEEMRWRRAGGESCCRIAVDYGVSAKAVSHICIGNSWAHIGGPRTRTRGLALRRRGNAALSIVGRPEAA
jgi:hypothetical protein